MTVPAVLVHGFATSSASTWGENGWLDLLADACRETVAIDLLGHGTAAKPHDPGAYDELEQLVAAALPAGTVDAIGFSLGARVLSVPVLVVIGDRDAAGPGEPLAEALPDARLVTLRGVDHFATPKNFAAIDATLDFLSRPLP
jgi:pimeloyl-ACP methyl ester carboxylesterase